MAVMRRSELSSLVLLVAICSTIQLLHGQNTCKLCFYCSYAMLAVMVPYGRVYRALQHQNLIYVSVAVSLNSFNVHVCNPQKHHTRNPMYNVMFSSLQNWYDSSTRSLKYLIKSFPLGI